VEPRATVSKVWIFFFDATKTPKKQTTEILNHRGHRVHRVNRKDFRGSNKKQKQRLFGVLRVSNKTQTLTTEGTEYTEGKIDF
jgi:hypothetical protein